MTDNRTTELREKLTERGIEYTTNDHLGAYETSWDGFTAMQLTPGAKLMMVFTPEQAIAATLGSETCEDVGRYCFTCSKCGWTANEPHHAFGGFWPKFCPNCGCKVIGG